MHTNHIDKIALSSKERSMLFNTKVVSVQIQRYIEAKQSVTLKNLTDAFPEITGREMYNRVKNLFDRGIVKRDGNVFYATYEVDPKGSKSDSAWRAARLLSASSFTPDQLASLANINREHSATLCRAWKEAGFLVKIGQKGRRVPIYKMISKEVIRPVIKQERKNG